MPSLIPIDHDPFKQEAPKLVPIDHDPFSGSASAPTAVMAPASDKPSFMRDVVGKTVSDIGSGIMSDLRGASRVAEGMLDPTGIFGSLARGEDVQKKYAHYLPGSLREAGQQAVEGVTALPRHYADIARNPKAAFSGDNLIPTLADLSMLAGIGVEGARAAGGRPVPAMSAPAEVTSHLDSAERSFTPKAYVSDPTAGLMSRMKAMRDAEDARANAEAARYNQRPARSSAEQLGRNANPNDTYIPPPKAVRSSAFPIGQGGIMPRAAEVPQEAPTPVPSPGVAPAPIAPAEAAAAASESPYEVIQGKGKLKGRFLIFDRATGEPVRMPGDKNPLSVKNEQAAHRIGQMLFAPPEPTPGPAGVMPRHTEAAAPATVPEQQPLKPKAENDFIKAHASDLTQNYGYELPDPEGTIRTGIEGMLEDVKQAAPKKKIMSRLDGNDVQKTMSATYGAEMNRWQVDGAGMPKPFEGLSKKDVIPALQKILDGKPLTTNQQFIADAAMEHIKRQNFGAKPTGEPVDVNEADLMPGMEVKTESDTYRVEGYDEDGFLVLKDGKRIRLAPEETIKAVDVKGPEYDLGETLKHKGPLATSNVEMPYKAAGEGLDYWKQKTDALLAEQAKPSIFDEPIGSDGQLAKERAQAEMGSAIRGPKEGAAAKAGEEGSLFTGGLAPNLFDKAKATTANSEASVQKETVAPAAAPIKSLTDLPAEKLGNLYREYADAKFGKRHPSGVRAIKKFSETAKATLGSKNPKVKAADFERFAMLRLEGEQRGAPLDATYRLFRSGAKSKVDIEKLSKTLELQGRMGGYTPVGGTGMTPSGDTFVKHMETPRSQSASYETIRRVLEPDLKNKETHSFIDTIDEGRKSGLSLSDIESEYMNGSGTSRESIAHRLRELATGYLAELDKPDLAPEQRREITARAVRAIGLDADMGTSTARELAIRRAKISSADVSEQGRIKAVQQVMRVLKRQGFSPQQIQERMGGIDLTKPEAIDRELKGLNEPNWWDKLFYIRRNAMLSRPTSWAKKALGDTSALLLKAPARGVAGVVEGVRSKIENRPQEVFATEAGRQVASTLNGIRFGAQEGLATLKNPERMKNPNIFDESGWKLAPIKGKLGEAIGIPFRIFGTVTDFFAGINYTAELHALAYRKAFMEGKRGDALVGRSAELLKNPPQDMLSRASDESKYRTFGQNLGAYSRKVAAVRNIRVLGAKPLQEVMPFFNTQINLLKFGLEHTPLNFARLGIKYKSLPPAEWAEGFGKATVGSTLLLSAYLTLKALGGDITASPANKPGEKFTKEKTAGIAPESIKPTAESDTRFSYVNLEPIATPLALTVDTINAVQGKQLSVTDAQDVFGKIAMSIGNNALDRTYSKGLRDALEALHDSNEAGYWLRNYAASYIPGAVSEVADLKDPYLREAKDMLSLFKSKVPGASETLPARYDLWGKPLKREGNALYRAVSPVWISTQSNDPVDKEIVSIGLMPGPVGQKMGSVKLTPEQYEQYATRGGQRAYQKVRELMYSPGYDTMSVDDKRDAWSSAIADGRAEVREELKGEYPELNKEQ